MARLAVVAILLAACALADAHAGVQRQASQHSALRVATGASPASLPEQGYEGKGVKHENMKSITADFGAEYGPTTQAPLRGGAHGSAIAVAVTAVAIAAQALF